MSGKMDLFEYAHFASTTGDYSYQERILLDWCRDFLTEDGPSVWVTAMNELFPLIAEVLDE